MNLWRSAVFFSSMMGYNHVCFCLRFARTVAVGEGKRIDIGIVAAPESSV